MLATGVDRDRDEIWGDPMKRSKLAFAVCGFLGAWLLSSGIACPVRAQSSASAQSKPAEYAGSETCKTCHEASLQRLGERARTGNRPLKRAALPSTVAKIAMAPALPT